MGSDNGGHGVTEFRFESLFDERLQFSVRSTGRTEQYIPARDIGANVRETHLGEQIPQVIHFYATFAEVDSAKQVDVVKHG